MHGQESGATNNDLLLNNSSSNNSSCSSSELSFHEAYLFLTFALLLPCCCQSRGTGWWPKPVPSKRLLRMRQLRCVFCKRHELPSPTKRLSASLSFQLLEITPSLSAHALCLITSEGRSTAKDYSMKEIESELRRCASVRCSYCGELGGASVQCPASGCSRVFHVACSYAKAKAVLLGCTGSGSSSWPRRVVEATTFCERHFPKTLPPIAKRPAPACKKRLMSGKDTRKKRPSPFSYKQVQLSENRISSPNVSVLCHAEKCLCPKERNFVGFGKSASWLLQFCHKCGKTSIHSNCIVPPSKVWYCSKCASHNVDLTSPTRVKAKSKSSSAEVSGDAPAAGAIPKMKSSFCKGIDEHFKKRTGRSPLSERQGTSGASAAASASTSQEHVSAKASSSATNSSPPRRRAELPSNNAKGVTATTSQQQQQQAAAKGNGQPAEQTEFKMPSETATTKATKTTGKENRASKTRALDVIRTFPCHRCLRKRKAPSPQPTVRSASTTNSVGLKPNKVSKRKSSSSSGPAATPESSPAKKFVENSPVFDHKAQKSARSSSSSPSSGSEGLSPGKRNLDKALSVALEEEKRKESGASVRSKPGPKSGSSRGSKDQRVILKGVRKVPAETKPISERQFYHARTLQPIQPGESEAEEDNSWVNVLSGRMLNEFVDLNEGEKAMMMLWNDFMGVHPCWGNSQCRILLQQFVDEHWEDVMQKRIFRNCVLHFCNLRDHGIIDAKEVYEVSMRLLRYIRPRNPESDDDIIYIEDDDDSDEVEDRPDGLAHSENGRGNPCRSQNGATSSRSPLYSSQNGGAARASSAASTAATTSPSSPSRSLRSNSNKASRGSSQSHANTTTSNLEPKVSTSAESTPVTTGGESRALRNQRRRRANSSSDVATALTRSTSQQQLRPRIGGSRSPKRKNPSHSV